MQLRPYQQEAHDAILSAYQRGVRRQIVAMATGAGKTVLFAHLVAGRAGNALVLAHRDRLIAQAAEKISSVIPWSRIGIVKAEQNQPHAQVVMASVQTLARQRRLGMMPKFDTVIIDECHRSAASTYQSILRHVCHEQTLLLGVTATPSRADGVGLDAVYEEIVYQIGILELIEQGYLVSLKGRKIYIPADFSRLHSRVNPDGIHDFKQDEVVDLMTKANWYQKVTEGWLDHASDRRTIAFVPPGRDERKRAAAMAHILADYMQGQGIRAAALDGTSEKSLQRQTIASFERGETQVLVNVDLMVEGVDIPSTNCILLARPTKSHIVKMQAIGRGTRLSPATGKQDCLVLDMVGATNGFDMVTLGDLIGVRSLRDGEDVLAAVARQRREEEEKAAEQSEPPELAEGRLVAENIDLFEHRDTREARPQRKAAFDWSVDPPTMKARMYSAGHTFEIWRTRDGRYCFADMKWGTNFEGEAASYREARTRCESEAWRILRERNGAPWRARPATEKQIGLLNRWRIPVPVNCTCGQASDLIDRRLQRRKAG